VPCATITWRGYGHERSAGGLTMKLQQTETEQQLAHLLVDSLNLELDASDIDPDAPLFGSGLGLDSIDMLEIALAISREYGVELQSEDREALSSLRNLASHIEGHRTQ